MLPLQSLSPAPSRTTSRMRVARHLRRLPSSISINSGALRRPFSFMFLHGYSSWLVSITSKKKLVILCEVKAPPAMSTPIFKRILLKISGEALAADQGFGVDTKRIHEIAAELADVNTLGIQMAIVVGGGNSFRWGADHRTNMERGSPPPMAILATRLHALA